jgi:hypothetical protein
MTTELENLAAEIRRATDYQVNKRILSEKIQTDLHFVHNGGLFKADPVQYTFVIMWQGDPDALYLPDTYGNPIKVNQQEFVQQATAHYQKVMNRWHQAHAELRKLRKI